MVEIAIEFTILMCLLILPLFGPLKRRKTRKKQIIHDKTPSDYGINEDGELELIRRTDPDE